MIFQVVKKFKAEQLLVTECDVLIPAALGDVFDKKLADAVNCRYIVEGANGPTLPEADEVFMKRGIIVMPDILANAGGVTVSYFEWAQNIQQFRWPLAKIEAQLLFICLTLSIEWSKRQNPKIVIFGRPLFLLALAGL